MSAQPQRGHLSLGVLLAHEVPGLEQSKWEDVSGCNAVCPDAMGRCQKKERERKRWGELDSSE
jgi:hypothetical protein